MVDRRWRGRVINEQNSSEQFFIFISLLSLTEQTPLETRQSTMTLHEFILTSPSTKNSLKSDIETIMNVNM